MEKKNVVEMREFFGSEVRVINGEWLVVKDMFGALGRLTSNGQIETTDRNKMNNIIKLLNLWDSETFTIPTKTTKSRGGNKKELIEVQCVKINDCPVILTQFKPTERAGKEALDIWVEFMKFVNNLLVSHNVNLFDLQDRNNQLKAQDRLDIEGGKVVIMNNMLACMLAELCGVEGKILKGDIRTFQESRPDIRFDLGKVYEEMREDFVNAYTFTQSHSQAKEMVLNKMKRKYNK